MDVVGALFALRHRAEELLRRVARVARHKADQKIAGDGVDHADEIGKIHVLFEVLAVGIDVLPQQRDVLIPGGDKLARLGYDVLRQARALAPADIRDDAVSAEVVAAVHDRKPGLDLAVAAHRDALGHGAVVLFGGEDAPVLFHDLLEQLRKAPQLVRAEYQVDHRIGHLDLLRHVLLLDHAAADRDDLPRPRLFRMGQRADVAQHAHLGVLAHGAGIHDDHVGLKLILREAVAHLGEIAAQLFAVGLVLLAAVGVHHRERAGAVCRDALEDPRADRLLALDFLFVDRFSDISHKLSSPDGKKIHMISVYNSIKGVENSTEILYTGDIEQTGEKPL